MNFGPRFAKALQKTPTNDRLRLDFDQIWPEFRQVWATWEAERGPRPRCTQACGPIIKAASQFGLPLPTNALEAKTACDGALNATNGHDDSGGDDGQAK